MTVLPAAGYLSTSSRTTAQMKKAFDDLRDVVAEILGGTAASELTISSGSVTPTSAFHTIDTEADAASDDLTNIDVTNTPAGRFILIAAANDARTVVVKHESGGSGQISLVDGADFSIDDDDKALLLVLVGTTWVEIYRKNDVRTNVVSPVSGTDLVVNGVYVGSADASISLNALLVRARTSDTADNSYVAVTGGGALANTRGAAAYFYGNEHANTGQLILAAGSVSGAKVLVKTQGTDRLSINHDGTATVAYVGTYTKPQRSAFITDNDGDFNLDAGHNFKCTPSGSITIQFAGESDCQCGVVLLINSGGHTISLGAEVKARSGMATDLTTAGTYWLSYVTDGTSVWITDSEGLS